MKYIYIQGNFVPDDNAAVSVRQRAFRFGDGIFETIRVENGKPYNFNFHIERLQNGCKSIKLAYVDVSKPAQELVVKNGIKKGFIRLSISRGEGSKGYLPTSQEPFVVIETIDVIEPQKENARLHISSYKAHVIAPAKTMNALNYTLAHMEAVENSCDNALLLDDKGNICETASGNIFWVKNGEVFTPAATLPLIPGSIRERILTLYRVQEVVENVKTLERADEIFMTNVNCLVQTFSAKNDVAQKIRKLIEDDIKSCLG